MPPLLGAPRLTWRSGGWGDMCVFGLAQQEFMEHLLWADWQEGGGSTTTLELQKGTAAYPSVPQKQTEGLGR